MHPNPLAHCYKDNSREMGVDKIRLSRSQHLRRGAIILHIGQSGETQGNKRTFIREER